MEILAWRVALKVGQLFDLPEDVLYTKGQLGRIKDKETETKILAKYEVVEIEGKLKGRIIVSYGNKRKNLQKAS